MKHTLNPWATIVNKRNSYVLENDWKILSARRKHLSKSSDEFKVLPIPYIGKLATAKVVLLLLNPGFSEDHGKSDVLMQNFCASYKKDTKRNLLNKKTSVPFFILNDAKYAFFVGYEWWHRNVKPVIEALGGLHQVQRHLMCIEFIPYHSHHFTTFDIGKEIPSQNYSFSLLEKAMKKGLPIILMKGKNHWLDRKRFPNLPDLAHYKNLIHLRSTRKSILSRENIKKDGFDIIYRALKS